MSSDGKPISEQGAERREWERDPGDQVGDGLPHETIDQALGIRPQAWLQRGETPRRKATEDGLAHRGVAGRIRIVERWDTRETRLKDPLCLGGDRPYGRRRVRG